MKPRIQQFVFIIFIIIYWINLILKNEFNEIYAK